MIVALEGLPGAGKTTAARLMGERLGAQVLQETTAQHPFLAQVYREDRDDLTVELAFLLVHANPYRRLNRFRLTVADYSPAKDELFAEEMLSGDDLTFFRSAYAFLYRTFPLPDLVVYLRAEPRLCLRRVRERRASDPSRAFEGDMTLERLDAMRHHYEDGLDRLGAIPFVYELAEERGQDGVADDLVDLIQPFMASNS